jgi:transcriptional regulator GlxA family with amidase domain
MNKKPVIDEVIKLIESNHSQAYGYKELCFQTNLSVRQLIDLFKEKNTTPMMFIKNVKNKSLIEKSIGKDTYLSSLKKI